MDTADIAALATALAGLIAAAAQWSWLIGPRRNGRRARLQTIDDRLAASELALQRCLKRLQASRRRERARHSNPTTNRTPIEEQRHAP